MLINVVEQVGLADLDEKGFLSTSCMTSQLGRKCTTLKLHWGDLSKEYHQRTRMKWKEYASVPFRPVSVLTRNCRYCALLSRKRGKLPALVGPLSISGDFPQRFISVQCRAVLFLPRLYIPFWNVWFLCSSWLSLQAHM